MCESLLNICCLFFVCELASWIYPSTGDDNLSVTHIFADGELKDYTEPEFINCDLLENPLLIDNYNNIIRDEFMPSSDIHTRESSISTDDFESNEAATPDELYVILIQHHQHFM